LACAATILAKPPPNECPTTEKIEKRKDKQTEQPIEDNE
jgi:hypothetical protein